MGKPDLPEWFGAISSPGVDIYALACRRRWVFTCPTADFSSLCVDSPSCALEKALGSLGSSCFMKLHLLFEVTFTVSRACSASALVILPQQREETLQYSVEEL